MAKKPTTSTAEVDAAHAAARNTDSGPAQPAPPAAGKGDAPTQKMIDTQALASSMPANPNKPLEYGEANALATPAGATSSPPSRLPTGSTLSEQNFSDKTGTMALEGVNATIDTLDRVRVDSTGQVLTTNQGVPVADNQHSL
ncbi:MAG: catalase HPII, partial [Variovorax sp.]